MSSGELLRQRLELIHRWYAGMVNPDTGMFEYLYLPTSNVCIRENCPIRDIATVWDAEVLGEFLGRDTLRPVIEKSLRHFCGYLTAREDYVILDSSRLGEPSSIAHSAFLLLSLLHAPPPRRRDREIAGLAEGILRQQRPDGSFKIYFESSADDGEELYSGEAMLALVEAYRHLRDSRCLSSAERGIAYYDASYFRRGRVSDDLLVFFANWQSQAGRLLAISTANEKRRRGVTDYLCRLHDRVIDAGFFDDVEHRPDCQVSVAVACALEGLCDAYALIRETDHPSADRYRRSICTGLSYLLRLQCTHGGTPRERGGFGHSYRDRTQRIDVTGHAASAFMKSAENGIECDFA